MKSAVSCSHFKTFVQAPTVEISMWNFRSILSVVLAATNPFEAAQKPNGTSYPPQVAQHMNLLVNPCDNFYKFSCGGYVEMPSEDDAARYSHEHVQEKNRQVLLTMLKSNTSVVSKYFDSCMDTTRINALGHKPLQPVLEKIDTVKSVRDLVRVAGELALENFNFHVNLFVSSDNTRNVLQIDRALPYDLIYQFGDAEYRKYISTLLTQAQVADSATVKEHVDTIVQLEKIIANIQWNNTIDPVRSSIYVTFGEASTKYPLTVKEFATGMFEIAGVPVPDNSQPIIIHSPPFLEGLENLLASTELSELKTLMKYQYIHTRNDMLGDQFTSAAFELQRASYSDSERPPREKFCVDFILKQLPNRMGKEYAALMFDTESAHIAKDMFSRIEATMKQRLVQDNWLDEPTRKKALQKLAKVVKLIGYSEEVEQVNELTLSAGDFFGITDSIQRSLVLQQIQKLFKPVTRGAWQKAAWEAKSYYNENQNSVVFPAGILQPPLFSKSYPAAINYGATATSMAHDLFHAVDEKGRWYDGYGNRNSWWTEETLDIYDKRTTCFVSESVKQPEDSDSSLSLAVQEEETLFENFAVASGFALAFETYQKFMEPAKPRPTKQDEPSPTMDLNLQASSKTDLEKLFYVAFAQSWCASFWAYNYLRVNGVIMNDPYFGDLFKCSVGTNMNPKDKCPVW